MKRLLFSIILLSAIVVTACGKSDPKPKIDAAHEDYGWGCPQLVWESGLTFGLTYNFPKLKDFVNPDFLNSDFAIEEIKKQDNAYSVKYKVTNTEKTFYRISFALDSTEKTISFSHIDIEADGEKLLDLNCPTNVHTYDSASMRKLGEFYGAMNECIPQIFDMEKMNAAIN